MEWLAHGAKGPDWPSGIRTLVTTGFAQCTGMRKKDFRQEVQSTDPVALYCTWMDEDR